MSMVKLDWTVLYREKLLGLLMVQFAMAGIEVGTLTLIWYNPI